MGSSAACRTGGRSTASGGIKTAFFALSRRVRTPSANSLRRFPHGPWWLLRLPCRDRPIEIEEHPLAPKRLAER
ncbi:hypothetical protein LMG28727_05301 [Paraburkholderia kirstenboschensis]|nr:hypothetical protein LMG28727_05301 [Paraburkholderia kirstenboschensis]